MTTMEAVDLPRSPISMSHRSKAPSAFSVVEAVVIGEAQDGLLQTLAKSISAPVMALLLLMSVNDTKMRNLASNTTRTGIVSFNA
jgi:hypothetical protein